MAHLLFLLHIGSSLYMMGLIWFVQVVHYPLHAHVGTEHLAQYQKLHMSWTSFVVGPPMLIEMGTTVLFLIAPPLDLPHWCFILGFAFLILIWASTVRFQMPYHNQLLHSFDVEIHKKLVTSNWIRTIFWSLRGILVLYTTYLLLKQVP